MQPDRFIEKFAEEIEQGTAAIFAGAGFSAAAGYVNWRELLRDIATDLKLNIDIENDLIGVAQFHVNRQLGNRDQLNRAILHELSSGARPTQNHRLLSRLPISTWWTTNYDDLIETAQRDEQKVPDVKHSVNQLAFTKPRRDTVVFKMHGDVEHPNDAVITRDDYERYEKDRGPFLTALLGDMISKTFLFVGFSFSDPNLSQVLSHIRVRFEKGQRTHYAIFKNPDRNDFENDEDFEYEKNRQILILEDLKRFNIQAVMVDRYSQIDAIIQAVYRKILTRYVFVSTSSHDCAPWGEEAVRDFMERLGGLLIERNARLVTGVGLGSGNALLGGAIVAISKAADKKIDDSVILRPFPQFVDDPETREEVWDAYRRDMIGRAGVALFLFGNKLAGGAIVPALGMEKELRIAQDLGLFLIPVGATGSIAEDFGREIARFDQPFPLNERMRELLERLQQPTEELTQLLGPIIDLIEAIKLGPDAT